MNINKIKLFLSLRRPINRNTPRCNVVILIRLDRLGDFIMSYSVFNEYRTHYSDSKLVLICNYQSKNIADRYGLFDEIIPIDFDRYKNDYEYQKNTSDDLSNMSADVVVQMVCNRNIYMDYISSIIKSENKFALQGELKNRARILDGIVYTKVLSVDDYYSFDIRKNFDLYNFVTGNNKKSYQKRLNEKKTENCERYYVLAIGGSFPAKKLEIEKYAEVVNYISEKSEYLCYIMGGKDDEDQLESFFPSLEHPDRCVSYVGKTSIDDCFNMVRDACFVICNDTSFAHMAVVYDTPAIVISGDFDKDRFFPYDLEEKGTITNFPIVVKHRMPCGGCKISYGKCKSIQEAKKEKFECIVSIESSEIIERVKELIKSKIM